MWGDQWQVRWFEEIDSTNTYLRGEAADGAPEGLVAVADHQTAGRGRLDRRWESPPGANLLASVLLRPDCNPDDLHLCTGALGLAAVDACAEVAGVEAQLKWPNDLLVGGAKLAGILAEADFSATPAFSAARRELILSPMTSMASGGGPIQVTPDSVTARAKSAFSEKKP